MDSADDQLKKGRLPFWDGATELRDRI